MYREALSARIDGEREPIPPDVVDRHLETCAECRSWHSGAQVLRRALVVRAAPELPDLTEAILERISVPRGARSPARIALGVVAAAQLALAAGQLLGVATGFTGMPAGSMVQHLAHESSAWNLGLGIGLFWAALRPRAASGQLPLFTGFVLVLTGLSVADVAGGEITAARLLTHVLAVLGAVLLFAVHRRYRDRRHPNPRTADVAATPIDEAAPAGEAAAGPPVRAPRRRRPAGHHRAA